jgi:hypothetical protein
MHAEVLVGRGCVFVRRAHGGWRRIVLCGPASDWAGRIGSATTQPPAVLAETAQVIPLAEVIPAALPRPGPVILRT